MEKTRHYTECPNCKKGIYLHPQTITSQLRGECEKCGITIYLNLWSRGDEPRTSEEIN
jgi:ribosomal protein S27AE